MRGFKRLDQCRYVVKGDPQKIWSPLLKPRLMRGEASKVHNVVGVLFMGGRQGSKFPLKNGEQREPLSIPW